MWGQRGVHTVIDLIRPSPLFVDEYDCHQDDDLGNNAKKGPQSSQATADTQVDLVAHCAEFVGPRADVISDVTFDAQVINGQSGLVGGALDLIFVASAVEDGLRVMFKHQVSNAKSKIGSFYFKTLVLGIHYLQLKLSQY